MYWGLSLSETSAHIAARFEVFKVAKIQVVVF